MTRRTILLATISALALAGTAQAETKVYNSTPPGGLPGDFSTFASNLCPTIETSLGIVIGGATVTDDGTGTVTLDELQDNRFTLIDIDTTLVFGPAAFIFLDVDTSRSPTPGQTGLGSTDKSSTVTWGLLSGFVSTGRVFCVSSPQSTCDDNGFMHGVTAKNPSPSATYNLGTWTFDTKGNPVGSAYISRTSNGGVSNNQIVFKAFLVGGAIPALPLVGFGILAIGLVAVGARQLMRKK